MRIWVGWSVRRHPGIDLALVRPVGAVKEIRCPLLFFHRQDNELADPSNSVRLFEMAGSEDRGLWLVRNVAHAKSHTTHATEYATRVQDFLSRAVR